MHMPRLEFPRHPPLRGTALTQHTHITPIKPIAVTSKTKEAFNPASSASKTWQPRQSLASTSTMAHPHPARARQTPCRRWRDSPSTACSPSIPENACWCILCAGRAGSWTSPAASILAAPTALAMATALTTTNQAQAQAQAPAQPLALAASPVFSPHGWGANWPLMRQNSSTRSPGSSPRSLPAQSQSAFTPSMWAQNPRSPSPFLPSPSHPT